MEHKVHHWTSLPFISLFLVLPPPSYFFPILFCVSRSIHPPFIFTQKRAGLPGASAEQGISSCLKDKHLPLFTLGKAIKHEE